jgi:hypothetical protein
MDSASDFVPKMENGAMSDLNYPRLSVGALLKQAIGCGYDIFIDLKGSGFDVDHHNFALVSGSTCCRMPDS